MKLGSNLPQWGLLWLLVSVGSSLGCVVVGQESVIDFPPQATTPASDSATAQPVAALTVTTQAPPATIPRSLAPTATTVRPSAATAVPTVARATSTGSVTVPGEGRYAVEPGDTLSALSRRFGVSTAELARLNNLSVDAALRVGQQVALPPGLWSDRLNIRVISPLPGSTVRSPIVIEGSASVFENIVNVALLDASGGTIARATERAASPDVGQHGAFRIVLALPESARGGFATIQVYWSSPRDGSPADLLRIPVTVVAGG